MINAVQWPAGREFTNRMYGTQSSSSSSSSSSEYSTDIDDEDAFVASANSFQWDYFYSNSDDGIELFQTPPSNACREAVAAVAAATTTTQREF